MERTRGKEAGRGPPGQGQRRARGPARRWPKARSHPGTLALCKGEKAATGRKHPRDWDAPRGATPWGQGRGARVGGVRPGRALPSDLRSALGHGTGFAATTATTLSGTTLAVASPRWHPHGGTPGGGTQPSQALSGPWMVPGRVPRPPRAPTVTCDAGVPWRGRFASLLSSIRHQLRRWGAG